MGFEQGKMFRCYPFNEWENRAYDATNRTWYKQAKAENKTIFTEPYMDAAGLGLMISIARPVHYANGTLIGVIAVDLTIQSMQQSILSTKILQSGYAFLTDDDGSTVTHPNMSSDAINTKIDNELLEGFPIISPTIEKGIVKIELGDDDNRKVVLIDFKGYWSIVK